MLNYITPSIYILPTPIGNLDDITKRAIYILKTVDIIVAENTFHIKKILNYLEIKNKKIILMNNYNEKYQSKKIIEVLLQKKNIALVSNAGTPLISDPGYNLIYLCHKFNINIVSLPGPCAAITALVSSGFSVNSFCYEGFLPSKKIKRIKKLKLLKYEQRTLIIYESKHRILDSLHDICDIFGKNRNIVFIKEMTKIWEKIKKGKIQEILELIKKDTNLKKGEIVLIIEGYINKYKNIADIEMIKKIFKKMQKHMNNIDAIKILQLIYKNYNIKKIIYKKII